MPDDTQPTIPINTPATFGAPEVAATGTMTVLDTLASAPATDPGRARPGVKRQL